MTRPALTLLAALYALTATTLATDAVHEAKRGAAAAATTAAPFDASTGKDTRKYAPDPQVDFQHLKLDLQFKDIMSRSFDGEATITFKTLAGPLEHLDLNAIELAIHAVTDADGKPLPYSYDDAMLTIRFDPPLAPHSEHTVAIGYTCSKPKKGLWFALPVEAYRDRPLMIHSQGEAENNQYWFPCHDSPNERCTTEMIVTIPKAYKALSNGALVEKTDVDDEYTRWHYRIDQPHVAYLVSLVIGEFEIVTDEWHGKPVEYWVPPGSRANAERTFGKTPAMIEVFSKVLDFDYPYAKYAQSVVYLFQFGGMENTSATTLYQSTMIDKDAPADDQVDWLIAHELAHQWFGDLITCRTWDHTWLNEGWATYMVWVWDEAETGDDEYTYDAWTQLTSVAEGDTVEHSGGVASGYSGGPMSGFFRAHSNPYTKGSSVLHMLRRTLGDDVFWAGVRAYLKEFQWREAESEDFRRSLEDVSGRNLERFFAQWVYRGGAPRIDVEYAWDEDQHQARVTLTQTQTLSVETPAFFADVDVWFVFADGRVEKRTLRMDQRVSTLTLSCDEEPQQVCVDPLASLLAKYEFNLPTPMLVRTATDGPALGARLYAVKTLSGRDADSARDALRTVLLDSKAHWGLRSQAAAALGRAHQDAARDVLLAALESPKTLDELRVRKATIDALAGYRDDDAVAEMLLRYARAGESDHIVTAAVAGLGSQRKTDAIVDVLLDSTKRRSRDEMIRGAAIRSLASLGEVRGIEPAMELARYGSPYRSRPTGISALGTLGKELDDKSKVQEFLIGLLDDPQDKVAGAVAPALGELGDREAIPALEAFANGAADERLRDAARNAIDRINRDTGESETIRDLRDRVRELEKFREETEAQAGETDGSSDED